MSTKKDAVQINSLDGMTDDNGLSVFNGAKEIVGNTPTSEGSNSAEGTTPAVASDQIEKAKDRQAQKANAARLAKLEKEIADKALSFVVLGNDLREIRDRRLYRVKDYPNFDDYCQARWAMSRRYADLLIRAAEVYANIENNCSGSPLPTNESQCRAVAKLDDPKKQVEAWQLAVEGAEGKAPTAEQVKAAIEARFGSHTPVTPRPEVEGTTPSTSAVDRARAGVEDEEVLTRTEAESDRPERRREFADHDRKRDGETQTADAPPFNGASVNGAAPVEEAAGEVPPAGRNGHEVRNGSSEPVPARVSPEDLLARLVKVVRVLGHIEDDIEGLGRDKGTRDDLLKQIDEATEVLGRIRGRVTGHAS